MDTLAATFASVGDSLSNTACTSSADVRLRRFRGLFGVTPFICAILWVRCIPRPRGSEPKHLLWALIFLKVYDTDVFHRAVSGVDEKTFRRWSKAFICLIADINVVSWRGRLTSQSFHGAFVSIDGTDVPINEPSPFSRKWYSHKLNGPGLRYEVAVSISTGRIVWAHGPFPCGAFPDDKIFRLALRQKLQPGELAVADKGYGDHNIIQKGRGDPAWQRQVANILARHETANSRLKHFNVLTKHFRHDLSFHSNCFHPVVNLTELCLENDSPLFSVSI